MASLADTATTSELPPRKGALSTSSSMSTSATGAECGDPTSALSQPPQGACSSLISPSIGADFGPPPYFFNGARSQQKTSFSSSDLELEDIVRLLENKRDEMARSLERELDDCRTFLLPGANRGADSVHEVDLARSRLQQQQMLDAQLVRQRMHKLQTLKNLDCQIKQLRTQLLQANDSSTFMLPISTSSSSGEVSRFFTSSKGLAADVDALVEKVAALKQSSSLTGSTSSTSATSNSNYFASAGFPPANGFVAPKRQWLDLPHSESSMESASMISYNSTCDDASTLKACDVMSNKTEVIYDLLSRMSLQDRGESSQMLLRMTQSSDTCQIMRQSGVIGLLIQILHPGDIWASSPTGDEVDTLARATKALHNLVVTQPDQARARREARILGYLEKIRAYVTHLRMVACGAQAFIDGLCETEICPTMATLMKLSFDDVDRRSTCQLGGLYAIAELLIAEHMLFGDRLDATSLALRKYAGMALTNLTFGDSASKSTLCAMEKFLETLHAQIALEADDLRTVYGSILRNLSWKADMKSKMLLRQSGVIRHLMTAAMQTSKESTLKSVLSALWNLSAHCSENKSEICSIPGALAFLVTTLSYTGTTKSAASKTPAAIVEYGGGILRNVSSHIALKEEYRAVLRRHGCMHVLLRQLRSESLTVVSNACGTLWNLSARNSEDQRTLCELHAVPMLRSLTNSKHKLIAMGSAAALKNLMAADAALQSEQRSAEPLSPPSGTGGSLSRRKLKALATATSPEGIPDVYEHFDSPSKESPLSASAPRLGGERKHEKSGQNIVRMVQDVTTFVPNTNVLNGKMQRSKGAAPPPPVPAFGSADPPNERSKELQIMLDKAAVQRFHNGLRRQKMAPPMLVPKAAVDGGDQTAVTDFSARYAERERAEAIVPIELADDAPRTYCVEGTPLISHAGSLTDLREKKQQVQQQPQVELVPTTAEKEFESPPSPAKNYAMEGTPGNFTRADSLSSLHDALIKDAEEMEVQEEASAANFGRKPEASYNYTALPSVSVPPGSAGVPVLPPGAGVLPPGGVAVQFTPLMFSRQSSLTSLDSCEQQTVLSTMSSEYSRNATGIVSPSELPESPGHTVPPSPKPLIEEPVIGGEADEDLLLKECIYSAMPKRRTNAAKNVAKIVRPGAKAAPTSASKMKVPPVPLATFEQPAAPSATTGVSSKAAVPHPPTPRGECLRFFPPSAPATKVDAPSTDPSSDIDDDGDASIDEAALLAECISSAMPRMRAPRERKTEVVKPAASPKRVSANDEMTLSCTLDAVEPPPDLLIVSGAAPVTMHRSSSAASAGESLSEDNYSHEEDDEEVVALDGAMATADDEDLLVEEMLIECEAMSRAAAEPRIVKPTEMVRGEEMKVVRGGAKGNKAMVAGPSMRTASDPKLAVRMTKTSQLRARRSSENNTSCGSSNASSEKLNARPSASPRPSDSSDGECAPPIRTRRPRSSNSTTRLSALSVRTTSATALAKCSSVSSAVGGGSARSLTATEAATGGDDSWTNALKSFSLVAESVERLSAAPAPMMAEKRRVMAKPAVPPKPVAKKAMAPMPPVVVVSNAHDEAPPIADASKSSLTRRTLGKNVTSKIASLWRKDSPPAAEPEPTAPPPVTSHSGGKTKWSTSLTSASKKAINQKTDKAKSTAISRRSGERANEVQAMPQANETSPSNKRILITTV